MKPVEIDITETFPRLSRAPIAEAVLEIRTRATGEWAEERISTAIRGHLPDYPAQAGQNAFQGSFAIQSGKEPRHALEDLGWCGVAAKSEDGRQIAFFERDRFLFSRLAPYTHWEDFHAEALRLWDVHHTFACPEELQRIGLRFVNQLPLPSAEVAIENYLRVAPKDPEGLPLPFAGFLHRDDLAVPGYDYGVSITRAIQTVQGPEAANSVLIIDVDVFTTMPVPFADANLGKCLPEMRWLKNRAFFGTISRKLEGELT